MADLRIPFESLSDETRHLVEKRIHEYSSPENKNYRFSEFTTFFKNLSAMDAKWDDLQRRTREVFYNTVKRTDPADFDTDVSTQSPHRFVSIVFLIPFPFDFSELGKYTWFICCDDF